ncbi:unnamed protein product [Oikopleura dioica]|uniref:ZP domain-containing protein n=1 Tax=Oikopleura dioica TaxID=34765 RepID=E4XBF4_OIKDI|nr:unnamed protein product [Oikopleura dioica]
MRLLFAVFLGLALAQFKNDRLLAHFENSAVKLKNADKKKGPNLVCGSDKIEISFEMAELDAMKLGVDDPTKIFFRGNKNCFSVLDGTKYTLTLFFPFTSCGTNVVHDTEDFVYTNQIMLQLEKNRDLTLLHFRCVYEDKYIVSYNEGITPVKRTLQFDTQMGKFDVDMKLYKI